MKWFVLLAVFAVALGLLTDVRAVPQPSDCGPPEVQFDRGSGCLMIKLRDGTVWGVCTG